MFILSFLLFPAKDEYEEGNTEKDKEIVILCVRSQPALGIKFILWVRKIFGKYL